MNESMNFGNIGFSNVTEEKSSPPVFENETEKTEEIKVEEDNTPNIRTEEEAKKDEEAQKDFENSSVKKSNYDQNDENFSNIDFGPLKKYLDDDDVTDISYSNGGQLWLKSLTRGVYRAEQQDVNNALMEKIAFQCSNIMGKTFNMAHPFLDSESAELRMNFVHDSIARNGIAAVFRKTPAKIRLKKEKLLEEKYVTLNIHDFLINCVHGHCNIIVCGETGSGKTELVKYLASHTANNEKLITIEDTLELHLDRIYPERDIVAMKTNNIASYSDVLVTCMRQNPIWILLSEVRSAEAVMAVRNSISSGHFILSTIHADKAESIPNRMYSLLESNQDVEQFLKTIYRYVQIGVFVRGRYSGVEKRFVREIAGVCEFHITDDNKPEFTNIYLKTVGGEEKFQDPSKYLYEYLEGQGVDINNLFGQNKLHVNDNGTETTTTESNESENADMVQETPVSEEQKPAEQVQSQNETETLDEPVAESETPTVNKEENTETKLDNNAQNSAQVEKLEETPTTVAVESVPATQTNNVQSVVTNVDNTVQQAQPIQTPMVQAPSTSVVETLDEPASEQTVSVPATAPQESVLPTNNVQSVVTNVNNTVQSTVQPAPVAQVPATQAPTAQAQPNAQVQTQVASQPSVATATTVPNVNNVTPQSNEVKNKFII